jgi:mono/diheme cytochrome c family protein
MSNLASTALFAASTAQRIGVAVAVVIVVAWVIYVLVTWRLRDEDAPVGAEIELAPNRRPYLDDEALEGPRLERFLGWGLILIIVASVGPLVYWLNEPGREAGAVEEFDRTAVERGRILFLPSDAPEHGLHFGCAGCHGGMQAQGGTANYTLNDYLGRTRKVAWAAPRLDTVMKRFSAKEVQTILIYGRANTPMPAWGVQGGGPMNAQQITDLVAYIKSIQVSDKAARQFSNDLAASEAKASGLSADNGATLFRAFCARCHTKGWSYGEPDVMGGGAFGPNLTNGTALRQFPDREQMIQFITTGTTYGKPYGVRGVGQDAGGGMPGFGAQVADENEGQIPTNGLLSPEQIASIVDYVRGL